MQTGDISAKISSRERKKERKREIERPLYGTFRVQFTICTRKRMRRYHAAVSCALSKRNLKKKRFYMKQESPGIIYDKTHRQVERVRTRPKTIPARYFCPTDSFKMLILIFK